MTDLKNVLVVDDDKAILEVIKIVLEGAGFKVFTNEGDGVEEVVKKERIGLILLDIWMVGVDGRQILNSLKKSPKTKKVPVVIISANSQLKSIARNTLADDYLEKPFDIENLVSIAKKYTS